MGSKGNKGICIFAKSKNVENYKVWTRKMTFVLRNIVLFNYTNDRAMKSILYTESKPEIISKKKIKKKKSNIEK